MALCQAMWFFVCVHIRSLGDGRYGFRPYGGSLGRAPSNQAPAPLTYGGSLMLTIPSLRSCSVGPPPSAIQGRGRLNRHPCRFAHCAKPPLGLPTRQIKIKSQVKSQSEAATSAKAAAPDTTPSRASSLPRVFRRLLNIYSVAQITVGAGPAPGGVPTKADSSSQTSLSRNHQANPHRSKNRSRPSTISAARLCGKSNSLSQ